MHFNNLLLFFVVYIISVAIRAEEYVSPMEYKDFSCDELKEEYQGVSKAELNTWLESADNMGETSRFRGRRNYETDEEQEILEAQGEVLEARLLAIEKAAKKIDCEVTPIAPDNTDSSSGT